MSNSPNLIGKVARGWWGKERGGILPGGWVPRSSWKTVDSLYIWSATAGVFAALALIAVALVMQTVRVP